MDNKFGFIEERPEVHKELTELYATEQKNGVTAPLNWLLSPKAIMAFVLGGKYLGVTCTPKWVGPESKVISSLSVLLAGKPLLLIGVPGTGKSLLSALLCAAIQGDSSIVTAGSQGKDEDEVTYSWDLAFLMKNGYSFETLQPSPVLRAMLEGKIVRIEEITRFQSAVTDSLLTTLQNGTMPIPQLTYLEDVRGNITAQPGFLAIATANTIDKGVESMSAAMRRRFGTVRLDIPSDPEMEKKIVELSIKGPIRDITGSDKYPKSASSMVEAVLGKVERLRKNGKTSSVPSPAETTDAVLLTFTEHYVFGTDKSAAMLSALLSILDREPGDQAAIKELFRK